MYDTGEFVFDQQQHILLRDMLANIKGKFVLSYHDDMFVSQLYRDFKIEEIQRSNNLGFILGKNKTYQELIISN